MVKKKRGRKPGVKVGPYKSRIERSFDLNEYLSPATMRFIVRDIQLSIQKLNAKSKIIERHLNQLKGKK